MSEEHIMSDARTPGALDGLRVLDLSGLAGQYCGKMFADLGAEVLLVEPPCGSAVRRDGPFLDNRAHPEYSLTFSYFNAGKRGICLDLDQPEGRQLFMKLVEQADLLIESEKPGVMAARGLDHASLSRIAPGLVMVSITPFGQTGPYARYESEDIIALALGGMLYLAGYPDTAPIAAHGNLAYLAAAQFAAVAAMMGLWVAEDTQANGMHIDVSIQECVTMGLETAVQFFDLEKTIRKRESGQQRMAGMGVFDCSDGQIYLMAGGISSSGFWETTVHWLIDAGIADAAQLLEPRWSDHNFLLTEEAKRIFGELFEPFALARTKEELYRDGQTRRIPICPINTPRDIAVSRQLAYRDFFVDLPHNASGRTLQAPGAPYRLSATPWRTSRPAPLLGEHTVEVLDDLGYDRPSQAALFKAGVIN